MSIYKCYKGDLRYSIRRNVTLIPHLSIRYSGNPGKSIYGFVGAYENQTPIPESLRLTHGMQLYLMAPFQQAVEYVDEAVIYAGIPNPGYGHFLLDALARLWYAKDHPEMPIIWDAAALPKLASPILDLVGIRNTHLFLDRSIRYREVVFPFPGVSIGDYFLKGHAEFLGVFKGEGVIPGKKLYLSRRWLNRGLVANEDLIEDLVTSYGFKVYYPEQHPIVDQLKEISSSSIVLGVEGSALHSVVLLKTPIHTRFYALARHRWGGGVFEHIRQIKSIHYTTLNLLNVDRPLSASSEVVIDIDLLERILFETRGLDEEKQLEKYIVLGKARQNDYLEAVARFKVKLDEEELKIYEALQTNSKSKLDENITLSLPMVRIFPRANTIDGKDLKSRAGRLNALADIISAERYLEIGVSVGTTFNQVAIKNKVAVDPKFRFDFLKYQSDNVLFYEMESDEYFAKHANPHYRFDLIFLDGLHQFEQTFRDLLNCLSFVHDRSLIVIDDTIPRHYAASAKTKADSIFLRKACGVYDNAWMGDVYKIVPAVHDFLPMYSYLTFPGHGQTVLFRQPRNISSNGVGRRFDSLEEISKLSYVDFLKLKNEGLYNILPSNEDVIKALQTWIEGKRQDQCVNLEAIKHLSGHE